MLAKISLAVLAIFNLYLLITVSKESRRDMANNIKLIPSRIKKLFPKRKQRVDDDKAMAIAQIEPLNKTVKMDFSEQCQKWGVACDDGKRSLKCWQEVRPKIAVCMRCECSICKHGKCPPAKKG